MTPGGRCDCERCGMTSEHCTACDCRECWHQRAEAAEKRIKEATERCGAFAEDGTPVNWRGAAEVNARTVGKLSDELVAAEKERDDFKIQAEAQSDRNEDLEKALAEYREKLPPLADAHWVNIVVRRNGKDEVYQADWLKALAPEVKP